MTGHLRIVRGQPTSEELAVLTAVVTAVAGGDVSAEAQPRRGRWNDPARLLRRPMLAGQGGWRSTS